MINPSERTSLKRWAVIAAAAFALLLCLEIATEQDDITILDVVVDAMGLLLIVLAAAGTAVVAIRFEARNQDISLLVSEHAATIADRERWRSKAETHLKGLSAALDEEFATWTLTPAEMDIGRLLLKGLSHRQIADLRSTSEQTVRQQAQCIYQKSGLKGKSEFSAYFLDALFSVHSSPNTLN